MVLSLHERRVIADMERSLSQEDPRLSQRLADFGRTYPEPTRPPPPVEQAPAERGDGRRAGRFTVWSIAVAITLLCGALALSAAGLLAAATVAALCGVACWSVYRRQRRRRPGGPPGGRLRR
ncbi:DUF3040 domain-containing protein [Streptomyces sp. NBC_01198]|uniref:DUF3040 domain-containing protein n=1 Tax=Streptomyces sp. NBC_01198 TaxID=2903769 RepID=UPI002E1451BC|nr:DUF3040 domain-containing protein [Streptomyces sp. NBC_01198]